MTTRPEDIQDTFHNRNLAPADWENLADQLLKRGVQKVGELRGQSQPAAERDKKFEPPYEKFETFFQGLGKTNRWSSTKSSTAGVSKTSNKAQRKRGQASGIKIGPSRETPFQKEVWLCYSRQRSGLEPQLEN